MRNGLRSRSHTAGNQLRQCPRLARQRPRPRIQPMFMDSAQCFVEPFTFPGVPGPNHFCDLCGGAARQKEPPVIGIYSAARVMDLPTNHFETTKKPTEFF